MALNPTPEDSSHFMLADDRKSHQFLSTRLKQFDHDPAARLKLMEACRAKWRQQDPSWTIGKTTPAAFKNCQAPDWSAELTPKTATFRKAAPKKLPHYDRAFAMGLDLENGFADQSWPVVSAQWKEAIEIFEPGIHDFYPLNLRFKDRSVDYFWFRNRQYEDAIVAEQSDVTWLPPIDGVIYYSFPLDPKFVTLNGANVSGKHWFQHCKYHRGVRPYVSGALMRELVPLLPSGVSFMSVSTQ